ncbi:hypothetical protein [Coxiella burnetii]|uniref:hypothetical protein n=1 Tax=Coxiella burnetii TaxID=777 RepID=UPI000183D164|nr:hypothetical protein [Coxiella burnetii]ACJ18429.1 enhanced entry protein [Coxiella burnetii CbuG_Q212]OYK86133.1 enhanced entry protein [Coxiella burnetii]
MNFMRVYYLKILFFCLISIWISPSIAAKTGEQHFPSGCRMVGYEFKNNLLLLKPDSETEEVSTLYLIHNISPDAISFAVEKLPTQSFSPSYKNTINPNHWAAFALNQPFLQLKCHANEISVNCENVINLCQYNRAKFAEHNQGTYWILKNGTRYQAIRGAIDNGILLRW